MSQLVLFGLEVSAVLVGYIGDNLYLIDYLQSEAFETDALLGVVGEKLHLVDAKIEKYLGSDAVLSGIGGEAERDVGLYRVHALVLEVVCLELVVDADSPALLPHVEEDA